MCHTSDENSSVKPYAAISEIAPSSSRSFGPVREAMRPATGESTIMTRPDGMTMRLAASSDSPNPAPVATGSSSICG